MASTTLSAEAGEQSATTTLKCHAAALLTLTICRQCAVNLHGKLLVKRPHHATAKLPRERLSQRLQQTNRDLFLAHENVITYATSSTSNSFHVRARSPKTRRSNGVVAPSGFYVDWLKNAAQSDRKATRRRAPWRVGRAST